MSHLIGYLNYSTAFGPVWVVLVTLVGLPLANELVQRAPVRAQSLLQFFSHMLLTSPMLGGVIAKFPVVGDLLYVFSPQDKTGIPKSLSKLYLDARAAKKANDNKPAPPAAGAAAALILIVLLPAYLAGCLPPLAACKLPAAPDVAKCKLEQDLISCGEKTGLDLIPIVLDLVLSAVGGTFDPGALVAQLESEGFKDVPCVLAAIQDYLMPVAPQLAGKAHDALVAKLKKDGRHGTVVIKLAAARSVTITLP